MAKTTEELLQALERRQSGTVSPTPSASITPSPTPQVRTTPTPPKVNQAPSTGLPRGKWGSGGIVSDIFDVLQTGQYGLAGAARGAIQGAKEGEKLLPSAFKGFGKGVKERASFSDVAGDLGVKNKFAKGALGLAGDIFLDPLNYLGVGMLDEIPKVGKYFKAGKKALKADNLLPKLGKTGQEIGEKFIYRYGQDPAYVRRAEKFIRDRAKIGSEALEMGKSLKFAPKDMEIYGQAFKKGQQFTPEIEQKLAGVLRGEVAKDPIVRELTEPIRKKFSTVWDDMVKEGIIPKEATRFKDQYLPTLYREFSEEAAGMGGRAGIATDRFLRKGDLKDLGESYLRSKGKGSKDIAKMTAEQLQELGTKYQKELGIIQEAAFPAAKGLQQEGLNLASNNFFKWVDTNFASQVGGEGLVMIPKAEKYGQLAGKYVPKYIKDEVAGVGTREFGSLFGKANKIEDFMTKYWKPAKTVTNPAQLSRNFISNFILNDLVEPRAIKEFPEAIRQFKSSGKYFNEAKQANIVGVDFVSAEIGDLLTDIGDLSKTAGIKDSIGKMWRKAVEKGGNVQQTMEEIGKLQQFIYQRKTGKSVQEAAQLAEKALFDYQKITPFERGLRKSWIPFYTFARKSIPLVAETALKTPGRLSKYRKAEQAVENLTPEREFERSLAPEYMRENVRLPSARENKRPYLSTQFIYPWGNIFEQSGTSLPFGLNIPAADLLTKAVAGRDPFYDFQKISESPLPMDQVRARTGAVARTLLPAFPTGTAARLAPKWLGYPDFAKPNKEIGQKLFGDVSGVRFSNLDLGSASRTQQYKIQQLNSQYTKQINEAAQKGNTKRVERLIARRERDIKKILGQ